MTQPIIPGQPIGAMRPQRPGPPAPAQNGVPTEALQPGGNLERFILDVLQRSPQAKLLRRGITPQKLGLDIRVGGVLAGGAVSLSFGLGADDGGFTTTHPSTGHYGVNFTRPMASGNYAVIGSPFTGSSGIDHFALDQAHTFDATTFGYVTVDNVSFQDLSVFFIAIGLP